MEIPAHLIDFTLGSSWIDPKECQPKVIDTSKDYQEALKQVAKANNKPVEELTTKEKEQAMQSIGLCDLDFQIP